MKTLKITLLCCLFAITATAQNIITIDNSPQSTTTHQTLQDALDAADPGDIIYIQPTATNYGNGIIDKPITIVGRSHSEANRISTADDLTIRTSGVIIKGINFDILNTSSAGLITQPPYTGLRLYDCKVNTVRIGSASSSSPAFYIDDVEVQGCIIFNFDQRGDSRNILVGNNIIRGSFTVRAPETVVIANNIFRSGNGDIVLQNSSSTATAIFYNNMFKTNASTDKTITLSSGDFNISNSLTYNYGAGNLTFVTSGTATFLENNSLLNTDPLFVDVDSSVPTSFAGSSIYNPMTRMDDLTLQAGSPALTGGGNGGEIGLFNSGFNFDYIGNPRDVPTLDIINYDAAVPKNGTINVTIKAKAH